jgi:Helix-turn-helix
MRSHALAKKLGYEVRGNYGITVGCKLLRENPNSGVYLAELLGITPSQISNWRTGITCPTIHWKKRMEKAIGIPAESWSKISE